MFYQFTWFCKPLHCTKSRQQYSCNKKKLSKFAQIELYLLFMNLPFDHIKSCNKLNYIFFINNLTALVDIPIWKCTCESVVDMSRSWLLMVTWWGSPACDFSISVGPLGSVVKTSASPVGNPGLNPTSYKITHVKCLSHFFMSQTGGFWTRVTFQMSFSYGFPMWHFFSCDLFMWKIHVKHLTCPKTMSDSWTFQM